MKIRKILFITALLTSLTNVASAAPANAPTSEKPNAQATAAVDIKEYDAIRKVLGLYIEGARQGKSAVMKPAFHVNAIMYGGAGESTKGGPIKALFESIDSHPPAAGLDAQVTQIDVQNQMAFARVETDNWNGARYSDMFLLMKDNGNWKILTKIFHQY